jgi:hypothetical protein
MQHTNGQDRARRVITISADGDFFHFSNINLFFALAFLAVDGRASRRLDLKVEGAGSEP